MKKIVFITLTLLLGIVILSTVLIISELGYLQHRGISLAKNWNSISYGLISMKNKIPDLKKPSDMRSSHAGNSKASNSAIFFGGSFTYGHGLKNIETIPFHFNSLSQKYHTYNFAAKGASINNSIYFAEQYNLKDLIKQQDGIIIYNFIDPHFSRSLGGIDQYYYTTNNPKYILNDAGEIKFAGSIGAHDGAVAYLKFLISSSYLIREKIFANPIINKYLFSESGNKKLSFCKHFVYFRNLLKKQLPNHKFIIVKYPGESAFKFEQCLVEIPDVKIIDFSNLKRPTEYRTHPDGWHPSSEESLWFAKLLYCKIEPHDLNVCSNK